MITATAFQLATLPLDPGTARRIDAANDWNRIRLETAGGSRKAESKPIVAAELQGQAAPNFLSENVDDLSIPLFLRRVTS